jgi:Protein of unknown function (DUF2752)
LLLGVLCVVAVPSTPVLTVCGYHWLTGRMCPLCGLTRGVFSLVKGHWREAVGFNALTPLVFVMLLGSVAGIRFRRREWTGAAAIFAAYGIARFFVPGI